MVVLPGPLSRGRTHEDAAGVTVGHGAATRTGRAHLASRERLENKTEENEP